MGPKPEYIETVITCEGDYYSPDFQQQFACFSERLSNLLISDDNDDRALVVQKVEPWNSVRVTIKLPKEAAGRLQQMAEEEDGALRDLGILAVQIDGQKAIPLIVTYERDHAHTPKAPTSAAASDPTLHFGFASPLFDGPSEQSSSADSQNMNAMRQNIVRYLDGQGNDTPDVLTDVYDDSLQRRPQQLQLPAWPSQSASLPFPNSLSASQSPYLSPSNRQQQQLMGMGVRPPHSHVASPMEMGSFPSFPMLPHASAYSSPGQQQQQHRLNFSPRALGTPWLGGPGPVRGSVASSASPLLVNLLQVDHSGVAASQPHGARFAPASSFVDGLITGGGSSTTTKKRKPRKRKNAVDDLQQHADGGDQDGFQAGLASTETLSQSQQASGHGMLNDDSSGAVRSLSTGEQQRSSYVSDASEEQKHQHDVGNVNGSVHSKAVETNAPNGAALQSPSSSLQLQSSAADGRRSHDIAHDNNGEHFAAADPAAPPQPLSYQQQLNSSSPRSYGNGVEFEQPRQPLYQSHIQPDLYHQQQQQYASSPSQRMALHHPYAAAGQRTFMSPMSGGHRLGSPRYGAPPSPGFYPPPRGMHGVGSYRPGPNAMYMHERMPVAGNELAMQQHMHHRMVPQDGVMWNRDAPHLPQQQQQQMEAISHSHWHGARMPNALANNSQALYGPHQGVGSHPSSLMVAGSGGDCSGDETALLSSLEPSLMESVVEAIPQHSDVNQPSIAMATAPRQPGEMSLQCRPASDGEGANSKAANAVTAEEQLSAEAGSGKTLAAASAVTVVVSSQKVQESPDSGVENGSDPTCSKTSPGGSSCLSFEHVNHDSEELSSHSFDDILETLKASDRVFESSVKPSDVANAAGNKTNSSAADLMKLDLKPMNGISCNPSTQLQQQQQGVALEMYNCRRGDDQAAKASMDSVVSQLQQEKDPLKSLIDRFLLAENPAEDNSTLTNGSVDLEHRGSKQPVSHDFHRQFSAPAYPSMMPSGNFQRSSSYDHQSSPGGEFMNPNNAFYSPRSEQQVAQAGGGGPPTFVGHHSPGMSSHGPATDEHVMMMQQPDGSRGYPSPAYMKGGALQGMQNKVRLDFYDQQDVSGGPAVMYTNGPYRQQVPHHSMRPDGGYPQSSYYSPGAYSPLRGSPDGRMFYRSPPQQYSPYNQHPNQRHQIPNGMHPRFVESGFMASPRYPMKNSWNEPTRFAFNDFEGGTRMRMMMGGDVQQSGYPPQHHLHHQQQFGRSFSTPDGYAGAPSVDNGTRFGQLGGPGPGANGPPGYHHHGGGEGWSAAPGGGTFVPGTNMVPDQGGPAAIGEVGAGGGGGKKRKKTPASDFHQTSAGAACSTSAVDLQSTAESMARLQATIDSVVKSSEAWAGVHDPEHAAGDSSILPPPTKKRKRKKPKSAVATGDSTMLNLQNLDQGPYEGCNNSLDLGTVSSDGLMETQSVPLTSDPPASESLMHDNVSHIDDTRMPPIGASPTSAAVASEGGVEHVVAAVATSTDDEVAPVSAAVRVEDQPNVSVAPVQDSNTCVSATSPPASTITHSDAGPTDDSCISAVDSDALVTLPADQAVGQIQVAVDSGEMTCEDNTTVCSDGSNNHASDSTNTNNNMRCEDQHCVSVTAVACSSHCVCDGGADCGSYSAIIVTSIVNTDVAVTDSDTATVLPAESTATLLPPLPTASENGNCSDDLPTAATATVTPAAEDSVAMEDGAAVTEDTSLLLSSQQEVKTTETVLAMDSQQC